MNDEDLRLAVYQRFRRGVIPLVTDVAGDVEESADVVREGLARLAQQRHLALDATGEITMAHPFSAVPLGFSVMGHDALWWGGCAWDSFALPHLLPEQGPLLVATSCPACNAPHAWLVDRHQPPPGDQIAHFLVPTAHMWDDVVHTCSHQRFFCSTHCVEAWLQRTGNERGEVLDVPTVWRLASRWYEGRLERGYRRRDPATAKSYLREVGLSGPFWGL